MEELWEFNMPDLGAVMVHMHLGNLNKLTNAADYFPEGLLNESSPESNLSFAGQNAGHEIVLLRDNIFSASL